ncbi:hypothetical protein INT43_004056, partial [Umbelopsis isabellina]
MSKSLYIESEHKLKDSRLHKSSGFSNLDFVAVAALTAWTGFIRLWKISQPNGVVFDEVHFGKFAAKYVNGAYFTDVHPPLGKLLIAGWAWVCGFAGDFLFEKIGDTYQDTGVPYVNMRFLNCFLGLLTVPILFATLRSAGFTRITSVTAALALCHENGMVANNRLILLDSILLFFIAFTNFFWINFVKAQTQPFGWSWWSNLALTGLGLGLAISTKWVGLFTIATIGVHTISQLWNIVGDRRIAVRTLSAHIVSRAVCLAILPLVIYYISFVVHFAVLNQLGDANSFMSGRFQYSLAGVKYHDGTVELVSNNAQIEIRHVATAGGYLHSHGHLYPSESKQQQITLYPFKKDENNVWRIFKKPTNNTSSDTIEHGNIVHLKHVTTGAFLHSHNIRAPLSPGEHYNEASGYNFEDMNNDWEIEIVDYDQSDQQSRTALKALKSKFRLRHVVTDCYLISKNLKLPKWGFGQIEVACLKSAKPKNVIWYIETSIPEIADNEAKIVKYSVMTTFEKFVELHKVMWNINNGLTKSHPYDSRPSQWPVLHRGINYYNQNGSYVYMLGNPVVYFGTDLAIAIVALGYVLRSFVQKRHIDTSVFSLAPHVERTMGYFFKGWFLHFLPFFLMKRQLFLHHYLPALYFAILLAATLFESLIVKSSRRKRLLAAAFVNIGVYYVYRSLIPITYGEPWSRESCVASKWLSTWDYNCN